MCDSNYHYRDPQNSLQVHDSKYQFERHQCILTVSLPLHIRRNLLPPRLYDNLVHYSTLSNFLFIFVISNISNYDYSDILNFRFNQQLYLKFILAQVQLLLYYLDMHWRCKFLFLLLIQYMVYLHLMQGQLQILYVSQYHHHMWQNKWTIHHMRPMRSQRQLHMKINVLLITI